MKLYVDGVDQGGGASINNLWTGGDSFWIAVSSANGVYPAFVGDMAEVAIWYTQLNDDEIKIISSKIRYAPLQVQRSNLKAYFPMGNLPENSTVLNYLELSDSGVTQTITNNPTCIADEISYP